MSITRAERPLMLGLRTGRESIEQESLSPPILLTALLAGQQVENQQVEKGPDLGP